MISLSFMQYLQDQGFGTIDDTIFYGELPLDMDRYVDNKSVMAVVDGGGPLTKKSTRCSQTVELWGRSCNGNWLEIPRLFERIISHFKEVCICTLPVNTSGCCPSDIEYEFAIVLPRGNIQNLGTDSERNMLYSISFEILYHQAPDTP